MRAVFICSLLSSAIGAPLKIHPSVQQALDRGACVVIGLLSTGEAKASDAFNAYLKGEEAFLKTEECLLASYAELVAFQAPLPPATP